MEGLQLLENRVLILPYEESNITKSGIHLLEGFSQKETLIGEVFAVGTGVDNEEMEVQIGDTVIFNKYSGEEITINGKDYLIMFQHDIFTKLLN